MKLGISAAIAVLLSTSAANAAGVLYRNDYNIGTDYMAAALASSNHTITTTSGDLSGFTLNDFDLVVYAAQNYEAAGSDVASINSYLANGGKVIFSTWSGATPALDSAFTGGENQTEMTVGSAFNAGITNPLAIQNTGWGTFSRDLSATANGTVAATWGNGTAAIVVGNGGRSIHNGFLTDTMSSSQLYTNQIGSLLGAGAVPEPSTWALMILGFGAVGGAMRRRQSIAAKVRFA